MLKKLGNSRIKEVNFFYADENTVSISLNETTSIADLDTIVSIFLKLLENQLQQFQN
jgi:hypothetical protein